MFHILNHKMNWETNVKKVEVGSKQIEISNGTFLIGLVSAVLGH